MQVTFPTMKGSIGKREYFACTVSLSEVPRLFTFNDVSEFTPEHRQQRKLNKGRIQPIARYILENEDGYLFSSIVASFQGEAKFTPSPESPEMGTLSLDLTNAKFVINDGQHRAAGITAALKENPDLGNDKISVLLFPFEKLDRVQQMFSDLNRYVVKTPGPLNILFDKRDPLAQVTLAACELVPEFVGMVDKERTSLPKQATQLFTLSALYDANKEFLFSQPSITLFEDKVLAVVEYWKYIASKIPAWSDVVTGKYKSEDLRRDTISTHSVILRALGSIGGQVKIQCPDTWKKKLSGLAEIDWRKTNPAWTNVVIVSGSVVSSRQSRVATKELLWKTLGLPAPVTPIIEGEPDVGIPEVNERKSTSAGKGNGGNGGGVVQAINTGIISEDTPNSEVINRLREKLEKLEKPQKKVVTKRKGYASSRMKAKHA